MHATFWRNPQITRGVLLLRNAFDRFTPGHRQSLESCSALLRRLLTVMKTLIVCAVLQCSNTLLRCCLMGALLGIADGPQAKLEPLCSLHRISRPFAQQNNF